MLIFDLQKPMFTGCRIHATKQHPLEALVTLADRSVGMMMIYSLNETSLSYTFLSYDPDTRKHITVEAPDPMRAFELAQAEYQRDTGPSRSAQ